MKRYFLALSFLLSTISIILTIGINICIAQAYEVAKGKTRALFGITELLVYGYQYDVCILGLAAFIFAALGKSPNKSKKIFAIGLSLMAVALVFVRCWQLFVIE
jgi:hypothetical protein